MSVVEKVFALEIPETVNVPLYSELAIPVGLAVLVTLLILTLEPTMRLCGTSVVKCVLPPS